MRVRVPDHNAPRSPAPAGEIALKRPRGLPRTSTRVRPPSRDVARPPRVVSETPSLVGAEDTAGKPTPAAVERSATGWIRSADRPLERDCAASPADARSRPRTTSPERASARRFEPTEVAPCRVRGSARGREAASPPGVAACESELFVAVTGPRCERHSIELRLKPLLSRSPVEILAHGSEYCRTRSRRGRRPYCTATSRLAGVVELRLNSTPSRCSLCVDLDLREQVGDVRGLQGLVQQRALHEYDGITLPARQHEHQGPARRQHHPVLLREVQVQRRISGALPLELHAGRARDPRISPAA